MKKIIILIIAIVASSCNSNAQQNSETKTKDYKVSKTEAEWKEILSPQEYAVLREAATERPHSSKLNDVNVPGIFVCAGCGNELYETKHKFESGTGWPSFDRPIEGGVAYGADSKLGYQRDEVHCADCGGHLGHVFDDGPRETTGKRHCINGVAMNFIPKE
ncbi:peptide-methionine (R)-S-oxide reductase MsrB [Antarcticibacterium flavum]|uniref:peptide-methionine (R)-S-oxide reductase n=1 Tax=Antarcticibacterium flavum TaxID=2058175 RepID=A0A5B7WZ05_9FLAO|nr:MULTISPECIES: peptide-methionine (R)-S-oxide reductase MsrB [Antarcticibacterium]MCM4161198.1 peptide-methionine (R)-S-oxide reductase [Antarcticibacterium sp. W02-3]QCY68300.1 peptide-methionine (R)-S-oxide reductase MsrB [Antarcticibacterium flavum]